MIRQNNTCCDAINWTRGMLLTTHGDTTDYSVYDGCHDSLEERTAHAYKGEEVMVNIYPNPNVGQFTIDLDTPLEKTYLQILSTDGRIVHQSYYASLQTEVIDLIVPVGTYFVQIKSPQFITTKSIIISK